jgi:hypothetical protein
MTTSSSSVSAPPVQRFCFVRLREEASVRRDAMARELTAELTAACAPHAVWVGVPGDDSAARWDLGIVIALPDVPAWQALAATAAFDEIMLQLAGEAAVVKAWTFTVPASP